MIDQIIGKFSFSEQQLWQLGQYDIGLVVLSITVAVVGASVAIYIGSNAATLNHNNSSRNFILLSGSLALGGSVWAMHFIGMLAFNLCTPVDYEFKTTLVSMLPSVLASWVALGLISRTELHWSQLVGGGVLVGAGIGTMHYLGMEAMEMAPLLRYDPLLFSLSIVIAVSLAILALWVRFGLSQWLSQATSEPRLNIVSGVVMGCAISGMHYMGMSAARFVQPAGGLVADYSLSPSPGFVATIAAITLFLSITVFTANLIFKYRQTLDKAIKDENRIRTVLETAVDGIVTIDQRGNILSANSAVERILGWQEVELLGRNVNCLMPEPYHSEHDGYLSYYLRTGKAKIIGNGRDISALHKDGNEVPIRLAIGEGTLEQESIFVAYITNIETRLAMETALRENEAKFRSLISNIPGAAYRCLNNDRWEMLYISDAVKKFTGYEAKQFLTGETPLSFADLINSEDADDLVIPNEPGQGFQFEYRITDSRGNTRWILDHGVYHEPENTPGQGWLDGFMMDITDRVMLERDLRSAMQAAEEASKMKSSFLANMSHEIRTPMNAIIGFSDVLLQTSLDEQQQRHMNTVNQSARSLLHLLNDILDSAKLEKGKLELNPVPFSLSQLLDLVISTFWIQAKKKNLHLDLQITGELAGYYWGAEDRIRQVLVNILGNAVKFTEQGSVTLSAIPVGDSAVLFEVKDTGIGIDDKVLDTIFDPFNQADGSMSRRYGGTGLGTSISKQLVELMGGWIEMSSVMGEGTRVRFQIPLQATTAPEQSLVERISDYQFPPLHILIVDDVETNLDLLNIILQRYGHQVTRASNGLEAFEEYCRGDFDLMLMDVRMPEMDGLTASRTIREWEQNHNRNRTPIIALTASVQDEEREATTAAGMDGFETKPVDIDSLMREMARVLGLEERAEVKSAQKQLDVSVDYHQGVALWGSKAALIKEIKGFFDKHPYCGQQLQDYLQYGQWRGLQERTHRLKGVAANLALPNLTRCFERLEVSVADENTDSCSAQILKIEAELKAIKQSLVEEDMPVAPLANEQRSAIDIQQLDGLLSGLQEAAMASELNEEALEAFRQMTQLQWPEQAADLVEAFNNFDFTQAQEVIGAFRRQLEEVNGG